MNDPLSLTGEQLLKIARSEELFPREADESKNLFRRFAKRWHPDHGGDDAVFHHVKKLYDGIKSRPDTGIWRTATEVTFTGKGESFTFKYRSHSKFELGEITVGDDYLAYALTRENDDLYAAGVNHLKNFRFADAKMRTEMLRFLPTVVKEIETVSAKVVILKKTPDQVLLSDVIKYYDGKLPSRHAAWILSRLYHLICYLKYAGLVHPGIQPDSILISPESHGACLVGGWWYAAAKGKKLIAAPGRTLDLLPATLLREPIANPKINSELVRSAGREMLGDPFGSKLISDKSLPKPMVTWLMQPGIDDAYKEYDVWLNKTVIDAFGPRKFIKMELTPDDLYEKV